MSSIQNGDRIADRYRIESVLATGGMGAVYRANDERLARAVAIKVLLAELASSATQIARFEREAVASARLSHPGIVQVYDFGKTDQGLAYLVMELILGRTLAAVLDEGRLEPSRAVDLAHQALGALSAAHGAGIIHRDLKPANLMLVPLATGREHVKILDFGIAQLKSGDAYARLTSTGDIIGTPSYMAPEQARGEACDPRTDVYSMGMVLWSCLTGRRPWGEQHIAQMIVAVQTEMPMRADLVCGDVPKAVALVVEKAIGKRADDRFSSAVEFADALTKAANAITPHTRAPLTPTAPNPFGSAPNIAASTPAMSSGPPVAATRLGSPAPPLVSPAPTAVLLPAQLPAPVVAPRPFVTPGPARMAGPPRPRARWWLRIVIALFALGSLIAIAIVVLVLGLGVLGWEAFTSLPNAEHPAAASQPPSQSEDGEPTCEAAERCCTLGEGPEDECARYLEVPLDVAACRAAIGSYGDAITQGGGDASPCATSYVE